MAFDFEAIETLVSTHMQNQPYDIACDLCGNPLDPGVTLDMDLDMSMRISPCSCLTDRIKDLEEQNANLRDELAEYRKGE